MTELDIKLKLLTGRSINVEGFGEIKPLTIREIIDMDYSKYAESLNTLLLEKKHILDEETLQEFDQISDLELIIFMADDKFSEIIELSYCKIFGAKSAFIDKEDFCIFLKFSDDENDFKVINRSNYDDVIKIIKLQNCIEHISDLDIDDDFNKESEEVKKFKSRLKELEKEREKAKKRRDGKDDNEESLDFYDIISSLGGKSFNTNEVDLLNFTIYQVYEKFKRIQIIDKYEIDVQTMLAGAKDVDIQHWTSKS